MNATLQRSSIVLEPVIEVLPSGLDPDRVVPAGARSQVQLDEEMRAALTRVGLEALHVEGTWALVRDVLAIPGGVDRLVAPSLDRVQPRAPDEPAEPDELGDVDEDDPREEWVDYVVPCGVAIRVDGAVRAWPGCCADWGVLRQLSAAIDDPSADDHELWLGHDRGGIVVACRGPELILRTRSDESGELDWTVYRGQLRSEIEGAWDLIDRFEALARPLIDARAGGPCTVRSRDRR